MFCFLIIVKLRNNFNRTEIQGRYGNGKSAAEIRKVEKEHPDLPYLSYLVSDIIFGEQDFRTKYKKKSDRDKR